MGNLTVSPFWRVYRSGAYIAVCLHSSTGVRVAKQIFLQTEQTHVLGIHLWGGLSGDVVIAVSLSLQHMSLHGFPSHLLDQ